MGDLGRILFWVLRKLSLAAFLTGLGLGGIAALIYWSEGVDFTTRAGENLKILETENRQLKDAVVQAENRLVITRTEAAAQKLRADQAAKVVRQLEEIGSGVSWLSTSSEQLKENSMRMERMKQMESDSRKRAEELDRNLVRIQWEKDGIELALQRNQSQFKLAKTESSPYLHYVRQAWIVWKNVLLSVVVVLMFIPSGLRLRRFWRS